MESTVLTINEVKLPIKEWSKNRIVTFKDIDKAHQRPDGTASRNFRSNRQHFIEGVDFFLVKKADFQNDEIRCLGIREEDIPNRGLTFITESGYLMIAKSFTDNLSWDVQRQLVNSYFKLKEVSHAISEELPIDTQALYQAVINMSNSFKIVCEQVNSMENSFDKQFIEFKQALERINLLLPDNKVKETSTKIPTSVNSLVTDPIRDTIRPLAEIYNDKSVGYNNTYRKVYAAMEVDWKYRQSRYKNKQRNKNKPSKFYLIESDTKLLSMFTNVVKRLILEATEVNRL
jgi:hypothetical protein